MPWHAITRLAGKVALYRAEAGCAGARTFIATNYTQWNAMLSGTSGVPGYPVVADYDGGGVNDYRVNIVDDADEFPVPNPNHDNDLSVVLMSTCIDPRKGARSVNEIVLANVGGTNYRLQAGHGSSHAGTENERQARPVKPVSQALFFGGCPDRAWAARRGALH